MRPSSPYFSTRQTAQMLGLSVGTVQRMVSSGVLQAYTTQGGHRRILASSVRQYCQVQGVPGTPHLPGNGAGVCIVHGADMPVALQQTLGHMDHVLLVSHPLELASLPQECAAFFMDARVPWLDWPELHRPLGIARQALFIVYNSAHLSDEQRATVALHAQLCAGDISADLITGFLLGLQIETPAEPPATSPPH